MTEQQELDAFSVYLGRRHLAFVMELDAHFNVDAGIADALRHRHHAQFVETIDKGLDVRRGLEHALAQRSNTARPEQAVPDSDGKMSPTAGHIGRFTRMLVVLQFVTVHCMRGMRGDAKGDSVESRPRPASLRNVRRSILWLLLLALGPEFGQLRLNLRSLQRGLSERTLSRHEAETLINDADRFTTRSLVYLAIRSILGSVIMLWPEEFATSFSINFLAVMFVAAVVAFQPMIVDWRVSRLRAKVRRLFDPSDEYSFEAFR
jgi:hypothetical protein